MKKSKTVEFEGILSGDYEQSGFALSMEEYDKLYPGDAEDDANPEFMEILTEDMDEEEIEQRYGDLVTHRTKSWFYDDMFFLTIDRIFWDILEPLEKQKKKKFKITIEIDDNI